MSTIWGNHVVRYRPTSGQARKASKLAHPCMAIECPECHAKEGQRCMFPSGYYGFRHQQRVEAYAAHQSRR